MHAAKHGRPPAPSCQIRLKEPVYNQWQSLKSICKNKASDSEFAEYLLELLQKESEFYYPIAARLKNKMATESVSLKGGHCL